jgi:hypothetical protein
MNLRAVKLYGTEEAVPEQRVLTAGPVTATFESGQLRWIKIGEAEAIRAIAFLVRDRNWGTAVPEISNLEIDEDRNGFRVTFSARCATADGDLVWRGNFSGAADGTIKCVAVASSERDFTTSRTGFVILHPLENFVGRPVSIEHTDGSIEKSRIAEEISPGQPFFHVRAMTHAPMKGVKATIRMEGDAWETEDHRNWTDASFKTYSRPLSLPHPYVIKAGEEVRQTVTLSFEGKLPKAPAVPAGPVTVRIGRAGGRIPALGLSVLPEDAERAAAAASMVKAAGVGHLNCRVDLRAKDWAQPLAHYRELAKAARAEIVLEVIFPDDGDPAALLPDVARAAKAAKLKPAAVIATPAFDLKSHQPGDPSPEGLATWQEIAAAARKAFPRARIGGGMLSNFTELNRKQPPKRLFDFITHATSGLVHAADDRSVMETLEAIGDIIRSTRKIAGRAPYRIGPSHIGNSFNPYGASYAENPQGGRATMARVEPRHRGLFGAAWHLGYLSQVSAGGLEAATMASPVGEFGIAWEKRDFPQPWFDADPGANLFPVFHVIRGVAAAIGGRRVEAQSSDEARVRTLAWRDGKTTRLWLANLRETPVEVRLNGLPKGDAQLFVLDENSFEMAARDLKFSDSTSDFSGKSLTLQPFAVARVDISG